MSGWADQGGQILQIMLSMAALRHRRGGAMLARTGNQGT